MKIIGDTNHIVYPRQYFVPEDENMMENEKVCWCYGVDQNEQPIMFRLNMNIEKVIFDKETKVYKPIIGENARMSSKNSGKEMPAIWNFFDEGEKNFFCAQYEENGTTFGPEGGVLLISKSIEIEPATLESIKNEFSNIYKINMPEAKYYECGYARVLNQGIPEEGSKKTKSRMKDLVALPIYGIGRLEMGIKKPSEKSMLFSLMNQYPDKFNRNMPAAKGHYNEFIKKLQQYIKVNKAFKQNQNEENKNLRQQLLNELNLFEGVELMRTYSSSNRYLAEWGKTHNDLENVRKIYLQNTEDKVIEQELYSLKVKADALAIEGNIADFKIKIFHPEDITPVSIEPSNLATKIDSFYQKYTQEGSYGGAYLRVLDNKNRSIPALGVDFQCKFLGPNKYSNAQDDLNYIMSSDKWNQIQLYLSQGLSFELVPFSTTKTPGPGKNSYQKISKGWIGEGQSTPMRDLYMDVLTGEYKNTYIVGIRRRNKSQQSSAFLVNVIATGYDGEAPDENSITEDGFANKVVRNRKTKK